MGMGQPTAEQIAQRAFDLGLLDERQLQDVWASFGSRNVKLQDFLQTLLRRELMTNYQVERLVKGERSGFFFGPYKVLYLMGSGTFARVYRAVHRDTGQVVALKVLRKGYSENSVQAGQFVREGRVGCALRHPNIVPIYEVVSEGKSHFLVMEFVEGRNLREFVKIRKKLDPVEATRLMIGLTDGLRYAFENGLTHRDLKMSNVLISSRGEAKIVDFGLASMDETLKDEDLADLPSTRTVDYAALERATGAKKDDTRSDIYFLGCIYYHMLTGQPPLVETRDRLQRLSKQRFLDVIPIQKVDPSIPGCVTLVVNKAMMLDPNYRYQSPSAMLGDLHLAAKRLAEEPAEGATAADAAVADVSAAPSVTPAALDTGRSVMVVESNAGMQDIFRKGFKRAGYRVLVTADPARAVSRLRQDTSAADCVIFNAQQIGQSALEMFNELAEDNKTQYVPAMLLLDETQHKWQAQARTARHRLVLPMPITMKQLRAALAELAPAKVKLARGGA
jgi:eukaryotic-like serine/threonine-protein kinase